LSSSPRAAFRGRIHAKGFLWMTADRRSFNSFFQVNQFQFDEHSKSNQHQSDLKQVELMNRID
jgi:hypothetical protein